MRKKKCRFVDKNECKLDAFGGEKLLAMADGISSSQLLISFEVADRKKRTDIQVAGDVDADIAMREQLNRC